MKNISGVYHHVNTALFLKLIQNIMMSDVNQDNHSVTFIVPDNTDVHVDAALKQISRSLDAFGA